MIIGVCTIELFLPDNGSLKDKRQVLKSLKDRVKQRFNVSIAEVDDQDLWQKTVIGVACVGNRKDYVNEVLDKVIGAIRGTPRVDIIDYHLELL
ncbi:MAG: DUF503 domain-containing protein [Nitrospirae bacterium]|nr:DUF503 domain-containing protein [Nitrospirota bacterium]